MQQGINTTTHNAQGAAGLYDQAEQLRIGVVLGIILGLLIIIWKKQRELEDKFTATQEKRKTKTISNEDRKYYEELNKNIALLKQENQSLNKKHSELLKELRYQITNNNKLETKLLLLEKRYNLTINLIDQKFKKRDKYRSLRQSFESAKLQLQTINGMQKEKTINAFVLLCCVENMISVLKIQAEIALKIILIGGQQNYPYFCNQKKKCIELMENFYRHVANSQEIITSLSLWRKPSNSRFRIDYIKYFRNSVFPDAFQETIKFLNNLLISLQLIEENVLSKELELVLSNKSSSRSF